MKPRVLKEASAVKAATINATDVQKQLLWDYFIKGAARTTVRAGVVLDHVNYTVQQALFMDEALWQHLIFDHYVADYGGAEYVRDADPSLFDSLASAFWKALAAQIKANRKMTSVLKSKRPAGRRARNG